MGMIYFIICFEAKLFVLIFCSVKMMAQGNFKFKFALLHTFCVNFVNSCPLPKHLSPSLILKPPDYIRYDQYFNLFALPLFTLSWDNVKQATSECFLIFSTSCQNVVKMYISGHT